MHGRTTAATQRDRHVVAQARPATQRDRHLDVSSSLDWIFVRDWVSELANQLLGRVKNRLLRFGIVLRSGTPVALSGAALKFAKPTAKTVCVHEFMQDRRSKVWCWLDGTVDPNGKLDPRDGSEAAREGDVIVL